MAEEESTGAGRDEGEREKVPHLIREDICIVRDSFYT
jgi:hypothetical protein